MVTNFHMIEIAYSRELYIIHSHLIILFSTNTVETILRYILRSNIFIVCFFFNFIFISIHLIWFKWAKFCIVIQLNQYNAVICIVNYCIEQK